jgi:predicted nucleic acid-binding protein
MLYLDTSLLVSLIAAEPSTASAQAWLAHQSREQLVISDWVGTEVASALAAIQRNGGIDDRGRVRAAANLKALVTAAVTVLPVSRQAFRAAADMAGLVELRLRSGDALHIAVAAEHGSALATRDAAQAQAAEAVGVPSRLVAGAGRGPS